MDSGVNRPRPLTRNGGANDDARLRRVRALLPWLGVVMLTLCPPLHAADTAAEVPRPVALAMHVTLDTVGRPDGVSPARHVGEVDQLRLIYDANAVDPVTRHVPLLNLQHLTAEGYDPPRPDPARMPMNDAWLDLGARPYRLHFRAAVEHGAPILIEFDEHTRRLTIRARGAARDVRIAGPYAIDPTPLTESGTAAAADPH